MSDGPTTREVMDYYEEQYNAERRKVDRMMADRAKKVTMPDPIKLPENRDAFLASAFAEPDGVVSAGEPAGNAQPDWTKDEAKAKQHIRGLVKKYLESPDRTPMPDETPDISATLAEPLTDTQIEELRANLAKPVDDTFDGTVNVMAILLAAPGALATIDSLRDRLAKVEGERDELRAYFNASCDSAVAKNYAGARLGHFRMRELFDALATPSQKQEMKEKEAALFDSIAALRTSLSPQPETKGEG